MIPFSEYIKIIGKGHKSGRALSQSEAKDAFSQILNGSALPEQIGAFLMVLRIREETPEELAGFVEACRANLPSGLTQLDTTLDMGCYSGKRRHLPWFLLAVKCIAATGVRVFMHGTAEPDSNRLYLHDVFTALSLPLSHTTDDAQTMLDKYGFCYMDLADAHPQLARIIALRRLFGLRSCANTIARMLNPSAAPYSYHGVHHRGFDTRHIRVAALLNDHNVSCIRGEGGEVEVNPERPFMQHQYHNAATQAHEFGALLDTWQIKPRELKATHLVDVWTGKVQDHYGQQAIIGTLSTYLVQLYALPVDIALTQANKLWLTRHRDFYASSAHCETQMNCETRVDSETHKHRPYYSNQCIPPTQGHLDSADTQHNVQ